ncbi:ABC transporter ATP-binding protein [Microbacterium nymphoidis]|uniref:ABC transporter ATP-binding protein n=1 Tax=Microbacterium nymphoidis TaxID=2898586 RepID=UPI001E2A3EEA|nr:ABC transporter ATP-binding protein [Microbacterium nymphoidis]MCD2498980.1 ABC transporter ATP-binding protein [Microbacterium nymphoidis]
MSQTTAPLLEIEALYAGIDRRDDPVTILRDVAFDIRPGEMVGVVGESGSGKSMTALAVMGLLPAAVSVTSGSVRFDGDDLVAVSQRAMREVRGRRIGMIFQDPMTTLDPVVKVGRQIEEAYRIHHRGASRAAARARAAEVLELVGVPDVSRRMQQYPHQWSGGMRQRAVIAMALVNDPDLLIADEPTTALDATIQAQVLEVLARARSELGVAIMLITHDLGVIAQYADRVIVMYAGQVMESATTAELFDDSRHPYSQALIRSRPALAEPGGRLPAIPGQPPSLDRLPAGCPFAPRCTSTFKSQRCVEEPTAVAASADGRLSACHYRDLQEMS